MKNMLHVEYWLTDTSIKARAMQGRWLKSVTRDKQVQWNVTVEV